MRNNKKYFLYGAYGHSAFLFVFLFFSITLYSQPYNQWAWMSGDTSNTLFHAQGAYNTFQTFNPTNLPPSLYEASEGIDNNGYFYVYGGDPTVGSPGKNDMWRYDPVTNQWAWMHGNASWGIAATYGTKGVPGFFNTPGSVFLGATSWSDLNGNFWLFGGAIVGPPGTNNLWKYDVTTNEWTWMHGNGAGSQVGVYGTKGVAAATNIPPERQENDGSWTDKNGNLWMFGGQDYNLDLLNDLWKYDISTNEWTWVSGTNGTNMPSVKGTKGVPSVNNYPGGRWVYASWKDPNDNFWLYAGNGGGDEIWMYNPATNEWTWQFGTGTGKVHSSYVTPCKDDLTNTAGSTYENRIRWADDCGNLWTFGGNGGTGTSLWRFNITAKMWKYIKGDTSSTAVGRYNVKGTPSPTNFPPPRFGGLAWRTAKNLWLFGGYGPIVENDMWKYYPDKPTASFTSSTSACTVSFTDQSDPNCGDIQSYAWDFGDGGSAVIANPSHTYSGAGTYTVTLWVTNCFSIKDSTQQAITISSCAASVLSATISATDVKCTGNNSGSALSSPSGGTPAYTYTWSNGQTAQTAINLTAGSYTVTVTDAASNTFISGIVVTEPAAALTLGSASASDTCGTSKGNIVLSPSGGTAGYTYTWSNGSGSQNLSNLAQGNFSVTVTDANNCTSTQAFVIGNVGSITVTSSGFQSICMGSTAQLSAGGASAYSWTPSAFLSSSSISNPVATPTITTTYTVSGTTGSCNDTDTLTVKVNGIPTANAGLDQTTTVGQSVNLNGTGGSTYTWTPSTDMAGNTTSTPVYSPSSPGIYAIVLTIADINGCVDTDTLFITVNDIVCGEVYIPTAFSPNKDGENDLYFVRGNCFKEFNLTIFDRWGEKVYESTNAANSWDGNFRGETCNTGVYVYVLNTTLLNGKEIKKKGNLTLLR